MRPSLVFLAVLALFISTAVAGPKPGYGPGLQDWGYISPRPRAHMFFWLYFTQARVTSFAERPLVIWLQGGPGASGVGYGNFAEIGPLDIHSRVRNNTWAKEYNLMFIDNPVGTGFSYVEESNLLTRTNGDIASDLVEFMRQFYEQYPEFKKAPLHIFSESYGGKMAIEFGWELEQQIRAGKIDCKLESIGLGNSWMSPIDSVLSWAPFLLEFGYVDIDGYNRIQNSALLTKGAVDRGQWSLATQLWGATEGVILQETGGIDFYNVLTKIRRNQADKLAKLRDPRYLSEHLNEIVPLADEDEDEILEKLMNGPVRQALGVNRTWSMSSGQVFNAQTNDFMKPVTKLVADVLDKTNIKVVVFTGQLDLIVATPGTVEWINHMEEWSGLKDYMASKRTPVVIDNYIEAYFRGHNNFYVYWINRAGHMSPADNPKALLKVMKDIAGY